MPPAQTLMPASRTWASVASRSCDASTSGLRYDPEPDLDPEPDPDPDRNPEDPDTLPKADLTISTTVES